MRVIRLRGLSKAFGHVRAVEDLTLDVAEGEVFGFLGPNGCGKSTTTKLLCTLLEPTAGSASIGGADVVAEALTVRGLVGYVPDRVPVYPTLTAREDLRLFARLRGVRRDGREALIETLLERVGLTDVRKRPVGTFSKGMTQRLGIARALVGDPRVLFLDEPASGLDPVARRRIRTLIRELSAEGKTVWLTSHDLAEVQAVCHRVAVMRQGRLVRIEGVGDRADTKVVELEYETTRDRSPVLAALREAPGVVLVEAPSEDVVRVTYEGATDRRTLLRALQRAGGTLLDVRDGAPSVEDVYLRYAHDGDGSEVEA